MKNLLILLVLFASCGKPVDDCLKWSLAVATIVNLTNDTLVVDVHQLYPDPITKEFLVRNTLGEKYIAPFDSITYKDVKAGPALLYMRFTWSNWEHDDIWLECCINSKYELSRKDTVTSMQLKQQPMINYNF